MSYFRERLKKMIDSLPENRLEELAESIESAFSYEELRKSVKACCRDWEDFVFNLKRIEYGEKDCEFPINGRFSPWNKECKDNSNYKLEVRTPYDFAIIREDGEEIIHALMKSCPDCKNHISDEGDNSKLINLVQFLNGKHVSGDNWDINYCLRLEVNYVKEDKINVNFRQTRDDGSGLDAGFSFYKESLGKSNDWMNPMRDRKQLVNIMKKVPEYVKGYLEYGEFKDNKFNLLASSYSVFVNRGTSTDRREKIKEQIIENLRELGQEFGRFYPRVYVYENDRVK